MSFGRKVTISTLAASLALGSLAGLPLGSRGVFQKLAGTATVLADTYGTVTPTPLNNSYLVDELNKLHENLLYDDEKDALRQARTNLDNLNSEDSANYALISEVMTRINAAVSQSGGSYDALTDANLLKLIKGLAFPYTPDGSSVTAFLKDSEHRLVMNQLFELGGVPGGLDGADGLTQDDAAEFAQQFMASLKRTLPDNMTALAASLTDSDSFKNAVLDLTAKVYSDLFNHDPGRLTQALKKIGITSDDMYQATKKIWSRIDPDKNALVAVALAEIRANGSFVQVGSPSDNGRSKSFQFKVLDQTVPVNSVDVEVSNDSIQVSKNPAFNTFKLLNPNNSDASTDVVLKINAPIESLKGKELFRQQGITLNYTSPVYGGGGGGGGGSNGGVKQPDLQQISADIQKTIDQVKEQLKNASPEEKARLLQELRSRVESSIRQLATLDLSATVKVDGDKAVPAIDPARMIQMIKDIAAQAKKLSDSLKALDPSVAPAKVELTLDLGSISARTAEIPLVKDILQAARDNGIDTIAVQANGMAVVFSAQEFAADTTLRITSLDKSTGSQANPPGRIVAGVYQVEFTTDGQAARQFAHPVQLRIPVEQAANLDPELLSIAKIDGDRVILYGGTYDSATKRQIATRYGMSVYTVVENRVSFGDIGGVKDWAGRQIEVAAAKGILEGRGEGQFVPDGLVTRAEFAKMIVKTFGLEDDTATENFADVGDDDWFKPYVAAAVKFGIVNGRSADRFEPDGTITRAEMAAMAARALVAARGYTYVKDPAGVVGRFGDAGDINASLLDGTATAAQNGIIVGEEGGLFHPNNASTRAQAAVVIYRLLNK